jgi:hypothetical protein
MVYLWIDTPQTKLFLLFDRALVESLTKQFASVPIGCHAPPKNKKKNWV